MREHPVFPALVSCSEKKKTFTVICFLEELATHYYKPRLKTILNDTEIFKSFLKFDVLEIRRNLCLGNENVN